MHLPVSGYQARRAAGLAAIVLVAAALLLLYVPGRPALGGGRLSIGLNLKLNNVGPDSDGLYLELAFDTARRYFGRTSFTACAGLYRRPAELLTALWLSARSGLPPREILRRKHRQGWGRLAKELGLHPRYWAAGRGKGRHKRYEFVGNEVFEQRIYLLYLKGYYGTGTAQLHAWLRQGLSHGDLLLGLNLAAQTGRPAGTIMALRLRGLSWTAVCLRLHRGPSLLAQAAAPTRRFGSRWDEWEEDGGGDWD